MGGKGSGGGSAISTTKAAFLNFVANSQLVPSAVYKITDVFEGLFVETLSINQFNPSATLCAYLPNYIEDADYKGQYHSALGAVADGEIYTWGEWNYKNESGGSLTPNTPSPNVFDTLNRFTQLAKSSTNYYTLIELLATIDSQLNITWVEHPQKLNSFDYYAVSQGFSLGKANAALAMLNQFNNFGDYIGQNIGVVIYNCRVDASSTFGILGNTGNFASEIYNSFVVGDGSINKNTFQAEGAIYNIVGNVNVRKNVIGGSNSRINDISATDDYYIDILHNELYDNNRLTNITGTGANEMYIWDNHLQENTDIANWAIDSTFVQFANCHLNNEVNLTDYTFNDLSDKHINLNFAHNVSLTNLTNISINSASIEYPQASLTVINLTGFAANIQSETIQSNKGWFSLEHNFSTNPITSGNQILYNLLPTSSYATNAVLIVESAVGGTGNLEIGINTDDTDYVIPPTAAASVANTIVNTLSNITTGNRSLRLAASGGDITSGIIRVKIEFIV